MIFYKCLKDKAMNIEINQYSYLSPKKNNNKQKETLLDATLEWFSYYPSYSVVYSLSIANE